MSVSTTGTRVIDELVESIVDAITKRRDIDVVTVLIQSLHLQESHMGAVQKNRIVDAFDSLFLSAGNVEEELLQSTNSEMFEYVHRVASVLDAFDILTFIFMSSDFWGMESCYHTQLLPSLVEVSTIAEPPSDSFEDDGELFVLDNNAVVFMNSDDALMWRPSPLAIATESTLREELKDGVLYTNVRMSYVAPMQFDAQCDGEACPTYDLLLNPETHTATIIRAIVSN